MLKYKVAGYIRLSKEDKIKDESNSVTNQKAIIDSYVKKNEDLELVDFYIDDGYSGTTFDRPEYKRMFKDICASYGIDAGKVEITEARDQNIGVTGFVMRNYRKILGRDAESIPRRTF